MSALFVDVSNWDRNRRGAPLDWAAMAAAGAVPGAMVAKATEGDPAGYNYTDPWFREHITGAAAAGYQARGAYHCTIQGDQACANRQVDWLRRRADEGGATWVMQDVEPFDELGAAWPRIDIVQRVADRWYALDQRLMAYYIPYWYWTAGRQGPNLGSPDLTGLHGPLISSAYPDGAGTAPAVYAAAGGDQGSGWRAYGGRTPDLWQYTSSADVAGASVLTDANAYLGSLEQLIAYLNQENDMANINQDDWDALIYRVEAIIANRDAVAGGPTQGHPNKLAEKLAELEAKIDALSGGGGGGGVSAEQVRAIVREELDDTQLAKKGATP
jgi:hypothetical protein